MQIIPLWWTRGGWILGLLAASWAGFMSSSLSSVFGSCNLPRQLSRPALAMELARDPGDVNMILDASANGCSLLWLAKNEEMGKQQGYDRIFIVLYVLFYLYLAVLCVKVHGWIGWLLAVPIAGLAIAAGCFDWREDNAILRALMSPVVAMHDAAYDKWVLLSLATGLVGFMFVSWRTDSLALTALRVTILATAIWSAICGWRGHTGNNDFMIESAAGAIFITQALVILFLLMVYQWRSGTHAALDALADKPVLHVIADWPPDDQEMEYLRANFPGYRRLENLVRERRFRPSLKP